MHVYATAMMATQTTFNVVEITTTTTTITRRLCAIGRNKGGLSGKKMNRHTPVPPKLLDGKTKHLKRRIQFDRKTLLA
eukprot:6204351-Amphidinium_carterae.1